MTQSLSQQLRACGYLHRGGHTDLLELAVHPLLELPGNRAGDLVSDRLRTNRGLEIAARLQVAEQRVAKDHFGDQTKRLRYRKKYCIIIISSRFQYLGDRAEYAFASAFEKTLNHFKPYFRFQISNSDFRFRISDFRFNISSFRFQSSNIRFQI